MSHARTPFLAGGPAPIWNISNRKRDNPSAGFSLIELLVVVAILAVLAAIAIPLFLNQKNKAYVAASTADIRNVIPQIEGDKSRPLPGVRWAVAGSIGGRAMPAGVLTDLSGVQLKSGQGIMAIGLDCSYSGSGNAVDSPSNYLLWHEAINNVTPDVLYDSQTQKWYPASSGSPGWNKMASCPNGYTWI